MTRPIITKARRLILRGSTRSAVTSLDLIYDFLLLAAEKESLPSIYAVYVRTALANAERAVLEATEIRDFLRATEAAATRAAHTGGKGK